MALRVRELYAATARNCAERAGPLLLVGAVVFVPLGLLDAVANRNAHFGEVSGVTDLLGVALVAAAFAQATTSLLGEVFYSGAVALLIARTEPGDRLSLPHLARSLAYGSLIAVDLLFGLGVAIGLVLLIVPGVMVFTWFALAGPLVELNGLGAWEAFARSRRLVRGHFFAVLMTLGPIMLASEAVTDAALHAGHDALGDSLLSEWLVESTTNIALSPLYAVAAVLITLQLSATQKPRLDRWDSRSQ